MIVTLVQVLLLVLLLSAGAGQARPPRELLKLQRQVALLTARFDSETDYLRFQVENLQSELELERDRVTALEDRLNSTVTDDPSAASVPQGCCNRTCAAQLNDFRKYCDEHVISGTSTNGLNTYPTPPTNSAFIVLMEAFQAEKMKCKVQVDHVKSQLHDVQSDVQATSEKTKQISESLKDIDKRLKIGAHGPPGVQGLPGKTGEKGEMGRLGMPGFPGINGLPGPSGPKGDPGLPGKKGEKGGTGSKGPQGLFGLPGPKGDSGLTGTPGEPGRDGQPGRPGERGHVGPVGPPGTHGSPGPRGPPGAAGPPGAPGLPGPMGRVSAYKDYYKGRVPIRTGLRSSIGRKEYIPIT